MHPLRQLRQRRYLTHNEPAAATPSNVARLLRSAADDLDQLPESAGEIVDMTLTPALRVTDGTTTLTTYVEALR